MPDAVQQTLLLQAIKWTDLLDSTDPRAREIAQEALRSIAFALLITTPAKGRA